MQKYVPAIIAAVIALIGVIIIATRAPKSDDPWAEISTAIGGLEAPGVAAQTVAVSDKDFAACVGTTVGVSVVRALVDATDGDVCRLPDVEVDVTSCLAFADPKATGESTSEALRTSISAAYLPIVTTAGTLAQTVKDEEARAWLTAVSGWLATETIPALIDDPSTGRLILTGQDVAGCNL